MLTIHNQSNQLFNCTSHFFGILVINCYDDIRRFPDAVTPDTFTVVNHPFTVAKKLPMTFNEINS